MFEKILHKMASFERDFDENLHDIVDCVGLTDVHNESFSLIRHPTNSVEWSIYTSTEGFSQDEV